MSTRHSRRVSRLCLCETMRGCSKWRYSILPYRSRPGSASVLNVTGPAVLLFRSNIPPLPALRSLIFKLSLPIPVPRPMV